MFVTRVFLLAKERIGTEATVSSVVLDDVIHTMQSTILSFNNTNQKLRSRIPRISGAPNDGDTIDSSLLLSMVIRILCSPDPFPRPYTKEKWPGYARLGGV